MTAEERTEKLILEIATLRKDVDAARQFTVADFARYLATHGIVSDEAVLAKLLKSMRSSGQLFGQSLPDGFRYSINFLGEERVIDLRQQALKEATASGASAPEPANAVAVVNEFDCEISEAALDGWWESSDVEIKIQAFNSFYKPLKAEA